MENAQPNPKRESKLIFSRKMQGLTIVIFERKESRGIKSGKQKFRKKTYVRVKNEDNGRDLKYPINKTQLQSEIMCKETPYERFMASVNYAVQCKHKPQFIQKKKK